MEIKQINPRRILISLTNEELDGMGLCYDTLDYHDTRTRAWLLSLLEAFRSTVEFQPGNRILIEVSPIEGGGCEIGFSGLDPLATQRWRVLRQTAQPVVYAFGDVDELITGAVKLFERCSHRLRQSALYRVGAGWRLAICTRGGTEPERILSEFASHCGEGVLAQAWLEEYAQPVLHEKAVELLCAYFG